MFRLDMGAYVIRSNNGHPLVNPPHALGGDPLNPDTPAFSSVRTSTFDCLCTHTQTILM
jgi:hypothetical protein